jgi:feruloyl-CoA synthase
MSPNKPANACPPSKPPFRPHPFVDRKLILERRADGTLLLQSGTPFEPARELWPQTLARQARRIPEAAWLAQRRGADRSWRSLSYARGKAQADAIAQALIALRQPGRPVMVLSGNSLEHAVMSLAAMQAGMPCAPVTPAYSLLTPTLEILQDMTDLLNPAVLFVQDGKRFERVIHGLRIPPDARFVCAGDAPDHPLIASWHDWLQTQVTPEVEDAIAALRPDAVAKYLFTSGSTGRAKAVVITHRMLADGVAAHLQVLTPAERARPQELLAWQPWSHVAGGSIQFGTLLATGGTMWLDDGKPAPGQFEETLRNLREISPTDFGGVPLGFSMLVDALEQDAALAQSFFRKLRYLIYAGAKMPEATFERMQAVALRATGQRIAFISGFGSTETSASVTIAHWATESAGCVGTPHPGMSVKLIPLGDERYEIRARGEIITPGYLNRPDATAQAFDDEGFFIMGDAVRFIDPAAPEEGLAFAGRVTEEFKLQSGTFVRVGALRVELIDASGGLFSDVVVAGADQPWIALLAWPNLAACRLRSGLPHASAAELAASEWMREAVAQALRRHNAEGGGNSRRVHRVLLLGEMPDMGAGEITDKGYVNQRRVLARRAQDVARLFAETADEDVIQID